MKKLIITMLICATALSASISKTKKPNYMKTIVLVHGAFADASSWDKVVPLLQAKGYEVLPVDLPGHGKDKTSIDRISMQSYIDAVKNTIGNRTDVILLGHSLAGVVISGVAEQLPGQIKDLIYLAAFVPHNGDTPLELSALPQNDESIFGKFFRPDPNSGSASIAAEGVIELFAADAPKEDNDRLLQNIKPEPLLPFTESVSLTDDIFGKVRKSYIHTIDDKAIAYPLQQLFVKSSNIGNTYSLKSSHTPFLSMPDKLAEYILDEAESDSDKIDGDK